MTTTELELRARQLAGVLTVIDLVLKKPAVAVILDALRSAILASGGTLEDERVTVASEWKVSPTTVCWRCMGRPACPECNKVKE